MSGPMFILTLIALPIWAGTITIVGIRMGVLIRQGKADLLTVLLITATLAVITVGFVLIVISVSGPLPPPDETYSGPSCSVSWETAGGTFRTDTRKCPPGSVLIDRPDPAPPCASPVVPDPKNEPWVYKCP